jgi:thymidylate synthase (FAD)
MTHQFKQRKVLNSGFVHLDSVDGDDLTVAQAARVSYRGTVKGDEKDKRLISFLMNNNHETPFEHVNFRFHIKCPIFVARQWFRHRWSSYNEVSGRYTVVQDDFYIPSNFRTQKEKNYKYENLPEQQSNELYVKFENFHRAIYGFYKKLLDQGVAKEQARMILPQSMYTEFYWTVNARALMNFLKLRCDDHAQWEIRQYALTILDFFVDYMPWTAEAFIKKEFKREQ